MDNPDRLFTEHKGDAENDRKADDVYVHGGDGNPEGEKKVFLTALHHSLTHYHSKQRSRYRRQHDKVKSQVQQDVLSSTL